MKKNSYRYNYLRIGKHKVLEFQLSRWEHSQAFGFEIWRRVRQDHAGLSFMITFFWHEFSIDFYDSRHWNNLTNDFEGT